VRGADTYSVICGEVAHTGEPDKNPLKNYKQANVNKLQNFIYISFKFKYYRLLLVLSFFAAKEKTCGDPTYHCML
jgi:hypothetical protein